MHKVCYTEVNVTFEENILVAISINNLFMFPPYDFHVYRYTEYVFSENSNLL